MTNDIATRGHRAPLLLSARQGHARAQALDAVRGLVGALAGGCDFTREIMLTAELGLGDTSLVEDPGGLAAMVLWHSAPLAEGRPKDEVRILKLAARDERAFDAAIVAVEAAAARARIRRVGGRCPTRYAQAVRPLIAPRYPVPWAHLRVTPDRYSQQPPAPGVLFS